MSSKDATVGVGAHWNSVRLAQSRIPTLRVYLPGQVPQDRAEFLTLDRNKQLEFYFCCSCDASYVVCSLKSNGKVNKVHRQLIPVC